MQIIYKLFYSPSINFFTRNVLKFLNRIFKRKFNIPVSGILQFRLPENKVLKIVTNQTNYVSRLLFWKGLENFEYTKIFLPLIKNEHTFIDIGANIGYYSLLAKIINPDLKVYSFEPSPSPYLFLEKNIALNNLKGIKTYNYALSNRDNEIDFFVHKSKKYSYLEHYLGGTDSLLNTQEDNMASVKVNAMMLDTFILNENISHVGLLKIDTEATEDMILEGANATIQKFKPIIVCEVLFQKIEDRIERIMQMHNYLFFKPTSSGLVKIDTIKKDVDDDCDNYFFIHPSRLSRIERLIAK